MGQNKEKLTKVSKNFLDKFLFKNSGEKKSKSPFKEVEPFYKFVEQLGKLSTQEEQAPPPIESHDSGTR